MNDLQMRFEALRLANGALCSGKFPPHELMRFVQQNYEFLKGAKAPVGIERQFGLDGDRTAMRFGGQLLGAAAGLHIADWRVCAGTNSWRSQF